MDVSSSSTFTFLYPLSLSSTSHSVQVNTALAFLVPALGMVLMSFVATPDLEVICVVVLVATFAFNGGTNAGHVQNIIGLAPNRFEALAGFRPMTIA